MSSKTIQDVTAIENVLVWEDKNSLSISRGKTYALPNAQVFNNKIYQDNELWASPFKVELPNYFRI